MGSMVADVHRTLLYGGILSVRIHSSVVRGPEGLQRGPGKHSGAPSASLGFRVFLVLTDRSVLSLQRLPERQEEQERQAPPFVRGFPE
ncbi:MAG: hypothetical protein LBE44_00650 [Microbacterium hominis]|nr:hypothetical protein [Microbacterium hominis]